MTKGFAQALSVQRESWSSFRFFPVSPSGHHTLAYRNVVTPFLLVQHQLFIGSGPEHGPVSSRQFPCADASFKIPFVDWVHRAAPPAYSLWEAGANHTLEDNVGYSGVTLSFLKNRKLVQVRDKPFGVIVRSWRRFPCQNGSAFIFTCDNNTRNMIFDPSQISWDVQFATE